MSKKHRQRSKNPPRQAGPRPRLSNQQSERLTAALRAQSSGQVALAESELRALIAERVRTPALFCALAVICARTGRPDEALKRWKQSLALDPGHVDSLMLLADHHQQFGRIDQAIECYRRVLAQRKDLVVARYLMANLLKAQGKLDEASGQYETIMAQQPRYTQAHFTYSGIHKYRESADPHLASMLELYEGPGLTEDNRIHLAFALGKAFEDIGEHARAFEFLKTGNDLRGRAFDYRIDGDAALIDSIIKAFTREAMSRVPARGNPSDRPIFIVGMPRSGTSLVEKILASHSDVYGAGELDYIFSLGSSLFLKRSADFRFKPLDRYPPELFERFAASYLEGLSRLDSETPRVTDKMPFNMMMIGLIKIALPNARIVHCVRDPRDTCLSIYKQNFTTANYRFAYDLKHLGQFHNLYRRLMRHWHDVMPGAIYDISYEALTADSENEIRGLLSACGLEWQASCLQFQKSAAVVKTASAYQVRQPMYRSSVKLWEKYRDFLGPLLDELATDS